MTDEVAENVLGNFNHQILLSARFSMISTIRFCVLQRFRVLRPSDFEHFNVLGNFNRPILLSSMFFVISTIGLCILQHFNDL